ncbi:MAG: DUF1127 domain-containing protein [Methylobacterium frigidaeris]
MAASAITRGNLRRSRVPATVSEAPRLRLVPSVALRPGRLRQVTGWFERLELWAERARERRLLAHAPDAMLRDIGLSRADAARESEKRFWQG